MVILMGLVDSFFSLHKTFILHNLKAFGWRGREINFVGVTDTVKHGGRFRNLNSAQLQIVLTP